MVLSCAQKFAISEGALFLSLCITIIPLVLKKCIGFNLQGKFKYLYRLNIVILIYIGTFMISLLSTFGALEWHAATVLSSTISVWFSAFVIKIENSYYKPKIMRTSWALIPMLVLFIGTFIFNLVTQDLCKL